MLSSQGAFLLSLEALQTMQRLKIASSPLRAAVCVAICFAEREPPAVA